MTEDEKQKEIARIRAELEKLDRKEFAILKKLELHKERNKILYFKPYAKQEPIFAAIWDKIKKTIIVQGGNRSGKTTVGIVAVVSLMLGKEPWEGGKELRFKPPIRVRVLCEDWGHFAKEVIIPKLREWVPAGEIAETRKNNAGVEAYWKLKNGSTLELMTYEQATEIFEGWSGHVVYADEPVPRDKFIACKRGLVDFDGIFINGMTPLKEPWIYDEIVTNPDPSIACFNLEVWDNPYLDKGAVEEFLKSLSPEERTAREKGQWLHLTGLIYKSFKKETHVLKSFDVPHKWTVRVVIDTHPRTEQALMFVATDERDVRYICKDIFKHGSPEDVADWIIDYHKKVHKIHEALIEPGSQGDQNRGDTTFTVIQRALNKEGITIRPASKDLETGIQVVQDSLKSRNGLASLFVFDCCERTIYEFTHYIWDEWQSKDIKTAKNKPRDKDDHMMENIYRMLLLPPIYIDDRRFKVPTSRLDLGAV
jgi:hypothetical protein